MQSIDKNVLHSALTNYYTQELKDTLYHLFLFEQKYQMDFPTFAQHEATLETEDFEKADDLMEWKSGRSYLQTIWQKLREMEPVAAVV